MYNKIQFSLKLSCLQYRPTQSTNHSTLLSFFGDNNIDYKNRDFLSAQGTRRRHVVATIKREYLISIPHSNRALDIFYERVK